MSANKIQIGGDHYKTDYEPWDLIIKWEIPFLEGSAIKYLTRWKDKGGLEDLKKVEHYYIKLIEAISLGYNVPDDAPDAGDLDRYMKANKLDSFQCDQVEIFATWNRREELEQGLYDLREYIHQREFEQSLGDPFLDVEGAPV